MRFLASLFIFLCLISSQLSWASTPQACQQQGAWLQVLGSGGPELNDGRASTSYLVWLNGQARLLVDAGAGSHQNFEKINADFNELTAIVFSHLHVDHSNDLPAYIKSSFFTGRSQDLFIAGPDGNHLLPATDEFLQRLFGKQGAWPYLSDHVDGSSNSYQLVAKVLPSATNTAQTVVTTDDFTLSGIGVSHGALPAIAWRIDFSALKRSVTFSGDMSGNRNGLEKIATATDLLVAHNAVPESATGVARRLHMPPSRIATIAKQTKAGSLLLSHRMRRTNEQVTSTRETIAKNYAGRVEFSEDLGCYKI